LLLLVAVCAVSAAQPKPADNKSIDRAEIERLIRRLGSDSFADRQEAMKELRRLGKPALEALRDAAANNADKEIRRRAAELVDRLLEPPYEKQFKEGVQLLDKKDYRKARTTLLQAIELFRTDPTIPRAEPGMSDQPKLAEMYRRLARACRGCEDHEGAAGAYSRAVYNYNYDRQNRARIESEWRAMIDGLLERWEKDVKAKIDKDAGLKRLTAKYPLVLLHSRRLAGGGYLKSAYSFIDETADDRKHHNHVQLLFDNGPGDNTFDINMTTDQRNLVVDLGAVDFTNDPDPQKVDPDSDRFWVPDRCKVVKEHVYLERVRDEEGNKFYALLKVIAADKDSRYMGFVWRRMPGGKVIKRR
jgi:tetratricopeptide (TPR) repeat protein